MANNAEDPATDSQSGRLTLQQARDAFYQHSGSASDRARNLAYLSLGAIWVLSGGNGNDVTDVAVQPLFQWAAVFLITGLAADFLQYAELSHRWHDLYRSHERRDVGEDERIVAPDTINDGAMVYYWAKLALVLTGAACVALGAIMDLA